MHDAPGGRRRDAHVVPRGWQRHACAAVPDAAGGGRGHHYDWRRADLHHKAGGWRRERDLMPVKKRPGASVTLRVELPPRYILIERGGGQVFGDTAVLGDWRSWCRQPPKRLTPIWAARLIQAQICARPCDIRKGNTTSRELQIAFQNRPYANG
jgi:hypothetical protein